MRHALCILVKRIFCFAIACFILHAMASLSQKSFHISCKPHLKVHIDHALVWQCSACLSAKSPLTTTDMFTPSTPLPVCTYSTFHCPKQRDVRSRSNGAVLTPLRAVNDIKEDIPVVEAAFIWKRIVPRTQSESSLDRCSGGAGQQVVYFLEVGSVPCACCLMER